MSQPGSADIQSEPASAGSAFAAPPRATGKLAITTATAKARSLFKIFLMATEQKNSGATNYGRLENFQCQAAVSPVCTPSGTPRNRRRCWHIRACRVACCGAHQREKRKRHHIQQSHGAPDRDRFDDRPAQPPEDRYFPKYADMARTLRSNSLKSPGTRWISVSTVGCFSASGFPASAKSIPPSVSRLTFISVSSTGSK